MLFSFSSSRWKVAPLNNSVIRSNRSTVKWDFSMATDVIAIPRFSTAFSTTSHASSVSTWPTTSWDQPAALTSGTSISGHIRKGSASLKIMTPRSRSCGSLANPDM